jgi:hypothetical protein
MKDKPKEKGRREFIRAGLRSAVLGGLAFVGLSVSRRKAPNHGEDTSCTLDLPCRICSRLPGCRKPVAMETKQMIRGEK